VFGIITTHYSNLKVFAFRNPGILNGNMHFDKDTLSPTYEMRIGRPGSSYAFEIAAKSGLPKDLIDYARNRTGSETAVDDILVDLQREKQTYEEQLRVLKGKEENLDRLIKTYDSLHHELEVKRKRLKLDQKEHELRQSAQATREIDKIVRTLKEEKNLEKAQQLSAQLRQERADKARAVHEINEEVVNLEERNKPVTTDRALQVGDFVRLRAGGAVGQIARVQGSKAEVQLGDLRVTAPLRDLLPAAAPLHANTTPATNSLQQAADFESKIDLRGMSKEEAFKVLEKFVDNSLLSNAAVLRILHGKGNGVLRTFVKQKLREYGNHVVRVYHPEQENGGDGVTIVELA
jgi:DNA mismatch repair protein MutS2